MEIGTPPPSEPPSPPKAPPRVESNLRPLLIEIPSRTSLSLRTPPTPRPVPVSMPVQPSAWMRAHVWALRFVIHLLLISIFETIFFWMYVSRSEDRALISLVNTYTNAVFAGCASMTPDQLNLTNTIWNDLVNSTAIIIAGSAEAATRTQWNTGLQTQSWIYAGSLGALVLGLGGLARALHRPIPWKELVGENLAFVTMLGLYEWMFFHTIAFQYKAISAAELDRMVVTEFQAAC